MTIGEFKEKLNRLGVPDNWKIEIRSSTWPKEFPPDRDTVYPDEEGFEITGVNVIDEGEVAIEFFSNDPPIGGK